MKREEIEKVLIQNDSTVLSFPDRGPWGSNRWRGNCSGWIPAFLIWKYNVKKMAELFAGGGTTSDVCKDMGIEYIGADLNPNPVRENILTTNCILDPVPDEFYGADMIFMHSPYSALINIPYAGTDMYPDPDGSLSKYDLGQMPWTKFIKELNNTIMKYYCAADNRMALLMGDVRRSGKFYSMLTDICLPGEVEQIIIKKQHNCTSDGRTYSNRNFVPIVHEYIVVLKKEGKYIVSYKIPQVVTKDIRDAVKSTWLDVVYAALKKLGGKALLEDIYQEVDGHKKCEANPHWKEKIRQTLQISKAFENIGYGEWKLAA